VKKPRSTPPIRPPAADEKFTPPTFAGPLSLVQYCLPIRERLSS